MKSLKSELQYPTGPNSGKFRSFCLTHVFFRQMLHLVVGAVRQCATGQAVALLIIRNLKGGIYPLKDE